MTPLTPQELASRPLSLAETAEYLKVSTRTVQRMIADGELPAKRVRGVWRITLSALQQYLSGVDNPPNEGEANNEGKTALQEKG